MGTLCAEHSSAGCNNKAGTRTILAFLLILIVAGVIGCGDETPCNATSCHVKGQVPDWVAGHWHVTDSVISCIPPFKVQFVQYREDSVESGWNGLDRFVTSLMHHRLKHLGYPEDRSEMTVDSYEGSLADSLIRLRYLGTVRYMFDDCVSQWDLRLHIQPTRFGWMTTEVIWLTTSGYYCFNDYERTETECMSFRGVHSR